MGLIGATQNAMATMNKMTKNATIPAIHFKPSKRNQVNAKPSARFTTMNVATVTMTIAAELVFQESFRVTPRMMLCRRL